MSRNKLLPSYAVPKLRYPTLKLRNTLLTTHSVARRAKDGSGEGQHPRLLSIAVAVCLATGLLMLGCRGGSGGGGSANSTGSSAPPDYSVAPNAPSGLTVTALADVRVTLAWSDNSNNETGFRLERRTGTGSYTQIAQLNANDTTFTDINVIPATLFTYRILAYNASGDSAYSDAAAATTLIVKTWGNVMTEGARAVARDGAGNIYITGWTDSFGAITATPPEAFVLKYDQTGILLWQRTWGGRGSDGGNSIAVTQAGDVYVTGSTNSFGVTYTTTAGAITTTDVFILKYTTDGALAWQKTWGGGDADRAFDIAIDEQNAPMHIYITGATNSFGAGYDDAFLISYDENGILAWQRLWGGVSTDQAKSVALDSLGNIYVTGGTNSFSTSYDAFLIKYNLGGTLLWQRVWGGSNDEIAKAVTVDTSNNVYIAGDTLEYGYGTPDVFLVNYTTGGTAAWQRVWGLPGTDDSAESVAILNQDICITGYTNGFGSGEPPRTGDGTNDILVLRCDLLGNILSQQRWATSANEIGYGIVTDTVSNIFIAGETSGLSGALRTITGAEPATDAVSNSVSGIANLPTAIETTPGGYESTPTTALESGPENSDLDALLIKVRY